MSNDADLSNVTFFSGKGKTKPIVHTWPLIEDMCWKGKTISQGPHMYLLNKLELKVTQGFWTQVLVHDIKFG